MNGISTRWRFDWARRRGPDRVLPFLGLLVGLLADPGRSWAGDVPPWLVAAAAAPARGDTGRAVVLLSEQTVRVSPSGKTITTERGAIRILRRDGSDAGIASVRYDAESERVRDITAWIIPADGAPYRLPSSREVDMAWLDESVYSDLRVRRMSGKEELHPGAVFGYEWIREDRGIFMEFQRVFQGELPCRLSRFTIELPRDWTAESFMFHHPPVVPQVANGRQTWELEDLPGVADEPARAPLTSLVPRLVVSCSPTAGAKAGGVVSFSTWADVAGWVDRLTEPMHVPTSEVAARAQGAVRGARNAIDSVRSVGRSVQRLRYASIPLGLGHGGGYRPFPAATTLARGYGDCKDKANLMRSMLAALGIESHLVAVNSGDPDYADVRWPSPATFNHCIIAIRGRDGDRFASTVRDSALGELTLFDPTHPFIALGDLPASIQGSLALVMDERVRVPLRVPRLGNGMLERRTTLGLEEDGAIVGRFEDRASGESATSLRELVHHQSSRDRQASFERWLSRVIQGAKITLLEAADDSLRDQISARVEFEAAAYAQLLGGHLLTFRPFPLPSVGGAVLGIGEPRRHPIVLPAQTLRETVIVRLPSGFRVDEMPDSISVDATFGRYAATIRMSGSDLECTRMLEVRRDQLPAARSLDVREFYRTVRRFEERPVVLARN